MKKHIDPEQFPQSERGRIVDTVWDGWRRVVCRWCGKWALFVDGETPEDRGYHRDFGRWWYCEEHSEGECEDDLER